jgi:hypothetical protein
MEIAVTTQLPTIGKEEIREALQTALRNESELARARRDSFEHACRTLEQQHQMSSTQFMQRFDAGELGDDAQYFDWYAAKRGLDIWARRFRILSGVSV